MPTLNFVYIGCCIQTHMLMVKNYMTSLYKWVLTEHNNYITIPVWLDVVRTQ